MKLATWAGGLLGLLLLTGAALHANLAQLLPALRTAGWPVLALLPWHLVFLVLYALGWRALLARSDPRRRAGTVYLSWVTTVREAADRLLPLPTIGGGLLGLRLVCWRGLAPAAVGASILAEMVVTFAALYVFVGLGLYALFACRLSGGNGLHAAGLFLVSLAWPVVTFMALRSGSAFAWLKPLAGGWLSGLAAGAQRVDAELHTLLRATPALLASGLLQLLGMLTGCAEVWLAMRLLGHPLDWIDSLILESLTQAVRAVAFFVPAGIGAQEAGLVAFGHALGVGPELSLALSMVKRIREIGLGVPALLSWQFAEARRGRCAP